VPYFDTEIIFGCGNLCFFFSSAKIPPYQDQVTVDIIQSMLPIFHFLYALSFIAEMPSF
jgi:hypothetical protein